jgi:hypothetical protein
MKMVLRVLIVAVGVATSCWPCWVLATESVDDRHVVSAGLFKNGLAVITEEFTVPGVGRYVMDDPPVPLYGTWWVESDAVVATRASEELVKKPRLIGQLSDLQRALGGREVVLVLRGEPVPLTGRVVAPGDGEQHRREWDRSYRRDTHGYWFGTPPVLPVAATSQTAPSTFLVVERDDGTISLVDRSTIVRVDVVGGLGSEAEYERRPVLDFEIAQASGAGATIRLCYLTKGIAWAPSYRVQLDDADQLKLVQQAVIKNELTDLEDAEIRLITGFPNVPFGHVTSPLSPTTSWSSFFHQLGRRVDQGHAVTQNVMTQQAVSISSPGEGGGALPDAALGGDGLDLHERSIGRLNLAEGESLALRTGSGEAAYERVVDWVVPDTRRADGRQVEVYERRQNPDAYEDSPWDAVRFRNPLGYPMTTGAVTVVENGRFRGQTMSPFTNPGGEVMLRITRALSITTRAVEQEESGDRELVSIGGRTFRQVGVSGELSARNHRSEAATVVVRRRFSGDLVEADQNPELVLLEAGVYSVNRRNELVWTVRIPPGETATLGYRYQVLVSH